MADVGSTQFISKVMPKTMKRSARSSCASRADELGEPLAECDRLGLSGSSIDVIEKLSPTDTTLFINIVEKTKFKQFVMNRDTPFARYSF